MTDLKKMTPSEVGRLGALARQGKYKAKKRVPKGRKPAQTPEAKEAARRQAAQQKRADVMASFGSFGRQTLPDLEALASGTEISPENADGMVMAGLAERLATGAVVLTRHGRTLYNAASRGDVGKAKEAIDRAEAAAGERMAREKGKPAADDKEAADAEKEKPKGGGGGGGGGKEKPSADDKQREQAAARAQTAQDTSERVGLGKDTLDTLRAAAEEGAEPDDGLVQLGLQDAAGDATDQGRRALAALERGDVRQYRAALQDAQARMERETAKQERKQDAATRARERDNQARIRQAERERFAAARERARSERTKRMDRRAALRVLGDNQKGITMDVPTILETLDTAAASLVDSMEPDATKAGRRNSTADQTLINAAYAQACALCDLLEALGADMGDGDDAEYDEAETEPGDVVEAPGIKALSDDLLAYAGDEVKALGEGWVGGYLVRFSDPVKSAGDLTHYRDMFLPPPETDYGSATKSDVYVHHRMLPGLGKQQLRNQAEIGFDEAGVFIKHLLDLRDPYERALYAQAQRGKLGWSSGTAPHLVERKALGDGRHIVAKWPLGLDASYTPTPAGGLEMTTAALKALAEAIEADPEADGSGPGKVDPDQATTAAADDRARRLRHRLTLLTLKEKT